MVDLSGPAYSLLLAMRDRSCWRYWARGDWFTIDPAWRGAQSESWRYYGKRAILELLAHHLIEMRSEGAKDIRRNWFHVPPV